MDKVDKIERRFDGSKRLLFFYRPVDYFANKKASKSFHYSLDRILPPPYNSIK